MRKIERVGLLAITILTALAFTWGSSLTESLQDIAIFGEQAIAPANPPVGQKKLYFDNAGELKVLDNTGLISDVGGGDFWPLTKLATGAGSFEIGPNSLSAGLEIFANGDGYIDLDFDVVNFKKRPKPNSSNTLDIGQGAAAFKDTYTEDIKFYGPATENRGYLDSHTTNGLTLRNQVLNGNLLLYADENDVRLQNQPTGAEPLAVATTQYVDNIAGASTTLNNLVSPTAINQDLIPSNDVKSLGADGTLLEGWLNLYVKNIYSPASQPLVVRTRDQTGVNNSGDITIRSGDGVDGKSGDLILGVGAVGGLGTFGDIILSDGSEGLIGDVWTSTGIAGEGTWATPAAGGGGDTYASTVSATQSVTNSVRGTTTLLSTIDTAFTTNATANPVEIKVNGRINLSATLTSGVEGDAGITCLYILKRSGVPVGTHYCAISARSNSVGTITNSCSGGISFFDTAATASTAYTYTLEMTHGGPVGTYSASSCQIITGPAHLTMVARQAQ